MTGDDTPADDGSGDATDATAEDPPEFAWDKDREGAPSAEREADPTGPPPEEAAPDDGDADGTEGTDGAPMADLAETLRERDSDPDLEEAFTEMDVDSVDAEAVWEQLESGDTATFAVAETARTDERGRDVRVVSKRLCHGCQHFAEPPAMRCTHDGTEIRKLENVDQYEVVDCPMVVDREDLDSLGD